MKDAQYEKTIANAELAIQDSDHRAALLSEMWQSLGISPQVTELLFSEGLWQRRYRLSTSCWRILIAVDS